MGDTLSMKSLSLSLALSLSLPLSLYPSLHLSPPVFSLSAIFLMLVCLSQLWLDGEEEDVSTPNS